MWVKVYVGIKWVLYAYDYLFRIVSKWQSVCLVNTGLDGNVFTGRKWGLYYYFRTLFGKCVTAVSEIKNLYLEYMKLWGTGCGML